MEMIDWRRRPVPTPTRPQPLKSIPVVSWRLPISTLVRNLSSTQVMMPMTVTGKVRTDAPPYARTRPIIEMTLTGHLFGPFHFELVKRRKLLL